MMGEAVSSGNLGYLYDNFDLVEFGHHMNCRDVHSLREAIDEAEQHTFLLSLFPDEQFPECHYTESFTTWFDTRYDNDTREVNLTDKTSLIHKYHSECILLFIKYQLIF